MQNLGFIAVAVDLGSTNIAVCCMNEKGREISSFSFANPQYTYGADIITRIKHCITDSSMLSFLCNLFWKALFEELEKQLKEDVYKIELLVISGNTTMQHIVRELSVEGLAAAPFNPVDTDAYAEQVVIDLQQYQIVERAILHFPEAKKHFLPDGKKISTQSKQLICNCIYPPGFSAFVGADILVGAQFLQMGKNTSYDLLVDLGTNGEILLLNKEQGFATSTACGPVFDHVLSGAAYGSESIHAIANCVKRRLIDKNGMIAAPFFEKGIWIDKNFVIRQQNVRNFQLAKGAIFAGIECLLSQADISENLISNVYISGGLGFYMDVKDAFTVGMLPADLKGKIHIAGNSSLNGAKYLLSQIALCSRTVNDAYCSSEQDIWEQYRNIKARTTSLELADLDSFQSIYLTALNF